MSEQIQSFEVAGATYVCHIPLLSVQSARTRVAGVRAQIAKQTRLESRVLMIDRHYDEVVQKANVAGEEELDAALAMMDRAAERSRVATEAASAAANEKLLLEYFCSAVDDFESFTDLPLNAANELYIKCRAAAMGGIPNPGEAEQVSST